MKKATVKRILAAISLALVFCVLMTGCAPAASDDAAAQSTGTQMIISLLLLVVVFYFFMIRPEKKRKKEADQLRSSLTVGDNIVTIGGMTGKIVNVTNNTVVFETGEDRVRIEIMKWGISRKIK